jgi:hypothetical protein
MNTKQLLVPLFTVAVAVIGFATATAAHANETSYENPVSLRSTLTRAEVRAEAARALAAGEFSLSDETYAPKITGTAKTRAQVNAETREAIRLGLISHGEETVIPTAEQLARVEMAGLRALSMTLAAR